MKSLFHKCQQETRLLESATHELGQNCKLLQLGPLQGRDWFELLTKKLVPQLTDNAFLVVAVVGGTNLGKSIVFNHIAGCQASATSPLASGTKHPVCLVPPGLLERLDLKSIFLNFELHEWSASDSALKEHDKDLLFWRTSDEIAENLLILDTPDIDSDAKVNWARADNIRRCADVLIAVLTQQKYNDAIVKQFFRQAAEEDKAVIVIFNQCILPEDDEYWPMWLDTFCTETNIDPEFVYIAPNDRSAAEENRLPFYERQWPPVGGSSTDTAVSDVPRKLNDDLSKLRFGEIKVRTLHGSLRYLLDEAHGLPSYLNEIEQRSSEFGKAAELLATHRLAEMDNWPPIPNSLMVAAIQSWWQSQREGWQAKVHNFYNAIGTGLVWPFKYARDKIQGPSLPPLETYRQQEWNAVLDTVECVYEKLTWFSQLGNELLQPRIEKILTGRSRSELLCELEKRHAAVTMDTELDELVAREMQSFREESPQFYQFLRNLDSVAAAARPATSIVLFFTGLGPIGNAAGQLVTDSVMQSVVHVAGDVAGGTLAAAVGETAISSTTASGVGYLEAKFRKMQAAFSAQRVAWLASIFEDLLLGSLPHDLRTATDIPQSPAFQNVKQALHALQEQMDTIDISKK